MSTRSGAIRLPPKKRPPWRSEAKAGELGGVPWKIDAEASRTLASIDQSSYGHGVEAVGSDRGLREGDLLALLVRGTGPSTTNALAERLGVTPASVSAMVKKLDERGLVRHIRYKGVALTPDGERVALEVMRHHRLLETYLAEHLGVPWDRVHEEAEALEHVLSEYLEAKIAAKLGHPTHDPHGDPIPTADLEILEGESSRLADAGGRRPRRFVRVSDSDPAMLRYLDERGVTLGDELEVLERQPFDGPLTVRFGEASTCWAGRWRGDAAMHIELAVLLDTPGGNACGRYP